MKKISFLLAMILASSASARGVYRYLIVHTDESKLVLRNEYDTYAISAKIYCWEHEGFSQGEVVLSTKNLDACTTTTLISASGNTCETWCW